MDRFYLNIQEMYRENYNKLYRMARKSLDHEPSRDAVQTAFLRLLEHSERYSALPRIELERLCTTIVKNEVSNVIRYSTKVETVAEIKRESINYKMLERMDIGIPENILIKKEKCREIRERIEEVLSIELSTLLYLRYYLQYTPAKISRIQETDVKLVEQRLFRAKKRCEAVLAEYCGE